MAFNPVSPVAGGTVPGFTTPTYTLASDVAPDVNAKQYAVTALGGTQAGVTANTVSKPFTVTMFRPKVLRALPAANPVTGVVKAIPMNSYKVITRKGALPAANQMAQVARITTVIEIPGGADTFDAAEIKAMLSLHFGVLSAQSSGIADTVVTGVL